MDAVGAVDVRAPGRAEHRRGPLGAARGSRARPGRRGRTPRPRRSGRRRRRRTARRRRARARPRARCVRRTRRRSPAARGSLRTGSPPPAARSTRAAAVRGGRGRPTSNRPCSAASATRWARSSASSRIAAVSAAGLPPIAATIARSVRDATIGSAIPSTHTRVRAPWPRTPGAERLERVDLVGAHVLPEAEEDHPGSAVGHGSIIPRRSGRRERRPQRLDDALLVLALEPRVERDRHRPRAASSLTGHMPSANPNRSRMYDCRWIDGRYGAQAMPSRAEPRRSRRRGRRRAAA